jgi:non-heme chloroperoxidase
MIGSNSRNRINVGDATVSSTLSRPPRVAETAAPHLIETRDGVRLYWSQTGRGRPVLFVNSLGAPMQMWDYQVAFLSEKGFRCVTIDRRGHGRSDQPADGYDPDTFADDLAEAIEALGLTGLTLVGHSMAAQEIVRYLTRHGGDRISRAILIAPNTPCLSWRPDNPIGVSEEAFVAQREAWMADYPAWVVENAPPFFTPETSPAMLAWGVNMMLAVSLPVMLACHRAMVAADFRHEMKSITTPTLILHGDRDASAPLALTGQPSADLLPNCRLQIYPGAPHGLMYTHMSRANADILAFLRDA